jgi:acyl-CoA hydrolase
VIAERGKGNEDRVKVTGAEVTFVNLDEDRNPVPIPREGAGRKSKGEE